MLLLPTTPSFAFISQVIVVSLVAAAAEVVDLYATTKDNHIQKGTALEEVHFGNSVDLWIGSTFENSYKDHTLLYFDIASVVPPVVLK